MHVAGMLVSAMGLTGTSATTSPGGSWLNAQECKFEHGRAAVLRQKSKSFQRIAGTRRITHAKLNAKGTSTSPFFDSCSSLTSYSSPRAQTSRSRGTAAGSESGPHQHLSLPRQRPRHIQAAVASESLVAADGGNGSRERKGEEEARGGERGEGSSLPGMIVRGVQRAVAPFQKLKHAIQNDGRNAFSFNYWVVDHFRGLVDLVQQWEPYMESLSDSELRNLTSEFKQRLAAGETLEDIQAEAFAAVREAGKRALNMRHFDVQIMGGAALHSGAIAEMKTGEGKTLVSTLPAYLNALSGKGVHVITVNDYLAKRDSEWMGRIHRLLGLSVGVVQPNMPTEKRRAAYACDVTYASNKEIGFDFLRDEIALAPSMRVMRWPAPLHFAIVDEVDSVLIDEGRNPLIISGMSNLRVQRFELAADIAALLQRNVDYTVDVKLKSVQLTEVGVDRLLAILTTDETRERRQREGREASSEGGSSRSSSGGRDEDDEVAGGESRDLSSDDEDDIFHSPNSWSQFVLTALKAKELYMRDRDYIVSAGEVCIVDEFTGRVAELRRWADGIHQAVEAKEKVPVKPVSETKAQITHQSMFCLYEKLAGMTGTAKTEEEEFMRVFKLPVVVIPTKMPNIRIDQQLVLHVTRRQKRDAVIRDISEMHFIGRPVLVGTYSVEESEQLSAILRMRRVPHNVLNARPEYAEREAEIVAQAGRFGAITISTNMAGRGTDIILGGNAELLARQVVKWIMADPVASADQLESKMEEMRVAGPHNETGFYPIYLKEDTLSAIRKMLIVWMPSVDDDKLHSFATKSSLLLLEQKKKTDLIESMNAVFSNVERNGGLCSRQDLVEVLAGVHALVLSDCEQHCMGEGSIVRDLGGLHVIGTVLRESRRIDNQLRGRAGRQGDPGSTHFRVSLEDDFMEQVLPNLRQQMIQFMQLSNATFEGSSADSFVARLLEQGQVSLEKQSFDSRREMLKYDAVFELHRQQMSRLRNSILTGSDAEVHLRAQLYIQAVIDAIVKETCPPSQEVWNWNLGAMLKQLRKITRGSSSSGGGDGGGGSSSSIGSSLGSLRPEALVAALAHVRDVRLDRLADIIPWYRTDPVAIQELPLPVRRRKSEVSEWIEAKRWKQMREHHVEMKGRHSNELMALRIYLGDLIISEFEQSLRSEFSKEKYAAEFERSTMIEKIDTFWSSHVVNMTRLQHSVRMQAYARVDPLQQYKIDSTRHFIAFLNSTRQTSVSALLAMQAPTMMLDSIANLLLENSEDGYWDDQPTDSLNEPFDPSTNMRA